MAGENNGGSSKLFQLVMVLVTSIVAPVTVYFSTRAIDSQKAAQQAATVAAPTLSAPAEKALTVTAIAGTSVMGKQTSAASTGSPTSATSLTPTLTSVPTGTPTLTATAVPSGTPTKTKSPTQTSTPTLTPFGVVKPSGTLAAGTPAASGVLAAWVEPGDTRLDGKYLLFDLHIRNTSDKPQTLTYALKSIIVQDGAGHSLEVVMGAGKHDACSRKELDVLRKVNLSAGQEITLTSVNPDSPSAWCAKGSTGKLPLYALPSTLDDRPMRAVLNKFGSFSGFVLELDVTDPL